MKKQQITFFDEEKRYEKLTALGDPLEQLNKVIKWEMFRSKLTKACQKEDTGKGGRPPIDVIVKFKASIIKRIYNLSYEQTEYQINDRLSFMRFLGISLSDRVLDANTIENAVEACKFVDENRYIKITGSHGSSPEQISFIVENNYKVEPHTNDKGVFLSAKHKGNGIGINSVRHIVGKYGGESSFMPENGVFTVSVMIYE